MSEVVLGVGASHSTLMNTNWHEVATLDRAIEFRQALGTAAEAIRAASPDVAIIVGSNHFRGFWLDLMPQFTIGVRECVSSGEGLTPSGALHLDNELALEMCRTIVSDGFDAAFSVRLQVDHGISHAVQHVLTDVDVPIVPIIINAFAPPLVSLARCDALGAALRRGIQADGANKRVVVIASGGLSHHLPFPDWSAPESDDDAFLLEAWTEGRDDWKRFDAKRREITRATVPVIQEEFDRSILRLVDDGRLSDLTALSNTKLEAAGGNGANELRNWMVMAAACRHSPGRTLTYVPMPEWLTGMAVAILEPEGNPRQ